MLQVGATLAVVLSALKLASKRCQNDSLTEFVFYFSLLSAGVFVWLVLWGIALVVHDAVSFEIKSAAARLARN
jgi:hypothetical protein|tara:strand:+ start:81 stop:299 length:219 start_codon:yes stop_codon:yes gene_type:complete